MGRYCVSQQVWAHERLRVQSPHVQLCAGLVRHAVWIPWRIPHDIDLGFKHAGQARDRVFDLLRQLLSRRATLAAELKLDRCQRPTPHAQGAIRERGSRIETVG